MQAILGRMLLVASLAVPAVLQAQDYPAQPIRIVIPEPSGGGLDRVSRMVAEKLRQRWGQPAELAQVLMQERERWGKVIRATGATVD